MNEGVLGHGRLSNLSDYRTKSEEVTLKRHNPSRVAFMTKLLLLIIVTTFAQTTFAQKVIKPNAGFGLRVYRGELFALDDSYIYDVKDVIFHPGSQAGYGQVQLLLSITNVTDSGKTFDASKEMIVLLIGVRRHNIGERLRLGQV
jgi:hypothetical protein